ncbi:hypothetical protein KY290_022871 [Solanum tuberosum]|uniref:Uncharacterized protein n=1 Tax=Solanum tuberosum TaxID=4113 RepID=A0ABQ7V5N8_SOLTU|nr:hypothetical protein KY284_021773 [Solanum tuberosum]KAH0759378.1 hypothetical protein KY290_022871 [Solanum tuberosum]
MDSCNMLVCIPGAQIEEEAPLPPPPPPPPPKALGCSAESLINLENDQKRLSVDIMKMSFIGGNMLDFMARVSCSTTR